jgi:hypothetical protein
MARLSQRLRSAVSSSSGGGETKTQSATPFPWKRTTRNVNPRCARRHVTRVVVSGRGWSTAARRSGCARRHTFGSGTARARMPDRRRRVGPRRSCLGTHCSSPSVSIRRAFVLVLRCRRIGGETRLGSSFDDSLRYACLSWVVVVLLGSNRHIGVRAQSDAAGGALAHYKRGAEPGCGEGRWDRSGRRGARVRVWRHGRGRTASIAAMRNHAALWSYRRWRDGHDV